jgi:hypothetical protein
MFKWMHLSQTLSLPLLAVVLTAVVFPWIGKTTAPSVIQRRREKLLSLYQTVIQPNTDLEAFALLAERAASFSAVEPSAKAGVDQFLDDLSWLIMGSPNSLLGIPAGGIGRAKEKLHTLYGLTQGYPALMRFGSSGFTVDDHTNQVQHFWFSVLVSYHFGAPTADWLARYHEWNAPGLFNLLPFTGHGSGHLGDLQLSRQAIQLGQALRRGSIQPLDVGRWLRHNL